MPEHVFTAEEVFAEALTFLGVPCEAGAVRVAREKWFFSVATPWEGRKKGETVMFRAMECYGGPEWQDLLRRISERGAELDIERVTPQLMERIVKDLTKGTFLCPPG